MNLAENVQSCSGAYYKKASGWLAWANRWRWIVFALSIFALFVFDPPSWFALFLIFPCLVPEIFEIFSENKKQIAERLKISHELHDGLGIKPDRKAFLDSVGRLPGGPRPGAVDLRGFEFASDLEPSPERTLSNLRESSWWSSQLGRIAFFRSLIFGSSLVTIAVLIPIIAPHFSSNQTHVIQASNLSASLVLGLFSLGIAKRCVGLHGFYSEASKIAGEADRWLDKEREVADREALILLSQYQTVRAASPPLPHRIWEKNQERLNLLYTEAFYSN